MPITDGDIVAALERLASIDRSLKRLLEISEARRAGSGRDPAVADDRDLDSQYGDPTVSFDPRDWTGESCKGRHLSECPAEFLELLAEVFDYFASKAEEDGDAKKAGYKRKDAARARGWAGRIRSGRHTPEATAGGGSGDPGWA